eukprot:TRINITY_DN1927_c0_g1_i1.p1 TRINITY_DN1927_c0_g1~~TRINITY_DN1927_c0_g1_i1.p1  ORF type:complete len:144 (-),score=35.07 TRINITY_DN1927_c0_g1_i1:224-655(-)
MELFEKFSACWKQFHYMADIFVFLFSSPLPFTDSSLEPRLKERFSKEMEKISQKLHFLFLENQQNEGAKLPSLLSSLNLYFDESPTRLRAKASERGGSAEMTSAIKVICSDQKIVHLPANVAADIPLLRSLLKLTSYWSNGQC